MVEPLVTARETSETASLPTMSWIALFVVAEFDAGAVYETVTVSPWPITDARPS